MIEAESELNRDGMIRQYIWLHIPHPKMSENSLSVIADGGSAKSNSTSLKVEDLM